MPVDAAAWTSLARVKEHLGITNASSDAKLENLINASFASLESYIGQSLKAATYTEFFDGDGTDEVLLNNYPVVAITSIHDDIDRAFGSDTLIDAADYTFYSNKNENIGRVRLLNGLAFSPGIQNVKVIYLAGYVTVPYDAEQACVELVAWHWNKAGTEGYTAQSLGGKSETYDMRYIPDFIRGQVQKFRKMNV
jgi:uncharacterized phiE125 gp8 family phage protein